jgi:hypothetical protein
VGRIGDEAGYVKVEIQLGRARSGFDSLPTGEGQRTTVDALYR